MTPLACTSFMYLARVSDSACRGNRLFVLRKPLIVKIMLRRRAASVTAA